MQRKPSTKKMKTMNPVFDGDLPADTRPMYTQGGPSNETSGSVLVNDAVDHGTDEDNDYALSTFAGVIRSVDHHATTYVNQVDQHDSSSRTPSTATTPAMYVYIR